MINSCYSSRETKKEREGGGGGGGGGERERSPLHTTPHTVKITPLHNIAHTQQSAITTPDHISTDMHYPLAMHLTKGESTSHWLHMDYG